MITFTQQGWPKTEARDYDHMNQIVEARAKLSDYEPTEEQYMAPIWELEDSMALNQRLTEATHRRFEKLYNHYWIELFDNWAFGDCPECGNGLFDAADFVAYSLADGEPECASNASPCCMNQLGIEPEHLDRVILERQHADNRSSKNYRSM